MKKEVVKNSFQWTPMDKRVDSLGFPLPPRKAELRTPLLWLSAKSNDGFIDDIYLVNSSGEALESVIACAGGMQTCDDEVLVVSRESVEYKNIANGDAVKVDEYHRILDSDSLLQLSLIIRTKHGFIEINSPPEKGGIKETVLLWDTKEAGRYVNVKCCETSSVKTIWW